MNYVKNLFVALIFTAACITANALPQRPSKSEVMKIIEQTNNYWQSKNPSHGNYFWNRAVYHVGNMEAYRTTGNEAFLDFSVAWAERNKWSGPADQRNWWGWDPEAKPSNWVYTYGENNVLFGDCQICFQVYSEIYDTQADERYLERAKEVMGYEIGTEVDDYLWWADGLFMVMPVMTHMYHQTGDVEYLNKMYAYWTYAVNLMWDEEEHLFYRDGSYVYPKAQTAAGGKDFWARGDGWVMAALARVLRDFDSYVDTESNPELKVQKEEYIRYYRMMAESLKAAQQPEGHWSRSILDVNQAPGYESTGTELMLYGFLWGVNNGYFADEDYAETIDKAWRYLTDVALHYSGKVGYMQPIGASASPGTYVGADSEADFGMGGFLLASSEMYRYADEEGYHRNLVLKDTEAKNTRCIVLTFNLDVDVENLSMGMFYVDGESAKGEIEVSGNMITLTFDDDLAYSTTHTVTVEGLKSTDGGDLLSDTKAEVYVDVPISEEQYYVIQHNASGLYMNFHNEKQLVVLSDSATIMRFVPGNEGELYLTNGTEYVGMAGIDNWTMSAAPDNAVTWTLGGLGNGLYSICGPKGCIGTDQLGEGSYCYGDKKASANNSQWRIVPVLANLDFDNEESFIDNHIITYAKDLNANNTTYCHQQPVDGWTRAADDVDGKAAGAFAYGTSAYLATSGYYVPGGDIHGDDMGGVLGLAACWRQIVQYTQECELKKGEYTFVYQYYNAGSRQGVEKNLFGVLTDDGQEFLSELTTYNVGEWATDSVHFTLLKDSRVTLSLGYESKDCGSGDSPKLFIDNVKIVTPGEEIKEDEDEKEAGIAQLKSNSSAPVFNLMGVKVNKVEPNRIYIVSGRKVIF